MKATSVHASPNAFPVVQARAGFVVATIAAIFMTVTEGLGTGIVPFWPRLAYWLIVMESGAVIGVGVTAGIRLWGRLTRYPLVEVLAIAVLIALPLTLAVIGAGILLLGMDRPSLEGLWHNFLLVAFISAIITGISQAVGKREMATPVAAPAAELPGPTEPDPVDLPAPPAPTPTPADTRLRARLPVHLQEARILALVSEDHYLRVRCEGGDALILMRLTDAIAELGDADGAQTHRSWWVARDAVASAQRADGKGLLTLADGSEAPVSRTHYRRLLDEGWFG